MNKFWKKRKVILEKYYPFAVAILTAALYYLSDIKFMDSFEDLLSASMGFASILIGFLGVLIALLFSLSNNVIRNYIFKNMEYKKRMYNFFKVPIISGFLFVILSFLLYLRKTIAQIDFFKILIMDLQKIITGVWIFFFILFISSSYRLIKIVLQIAFSESNNEKQLENKEDIYDEKEYNEIKKMYTITNEKKNNP